MEAITCQLSHLSHGLSVVACGDKAVRLYQFTQHVRTAVKSENIRYSHPAGMINGRTLRDALGDRKDHPFGSVPVNAWVPVCPIAHTGILGSAGKDQLPFQSHDGVMRVASDYDEPSLGVVRSVFGFRFTEQALEHGMRLVSADFENTRKVEALGAKITDQSSDIDILNFSEKVHEWGRGARVWGNLQKHNSHDSLVLALRRWLTGIRPDTTAEIAISGGIQIKGLSVSFASKHLRMLAPTRYAVLDEVFESGLGIARNPKGYQLFMNALHSYKQTYCDTRPVASIEAGLFYLVRQVVRSTAQL